MIPIKSCDLTTLAGPVNIRPHIDGPLAASLACAMAIVLPFEESMHRATLELGKDA